MKTTAGQALRFRGQRPAADAAGQVRGTALNHGAAAGHLSAHHVGSITPQGLAHLPAPLRHVITAAFVSALPSLYAYLIPLLAVAFLLALLLKETPLRAHTGLDAPQASPYPPEPALGHPTDGLSCRNHARAPNCPSAGELRLSTIRSSS